MHTILHPRLQPKGKTHASGHRSFCVWKISLIDGYGKQLFSNTQIHFGIIQKLLIGEFKLMGMNLPAMAHVKLIRVYLKRLSLLCCFGPHISQIIDQVTQHRNLFRFCLLNQL